MKRGTVERQLCHLEEKVRALPNNVVLELVGFATKNENLRILELLSKLEHIKQPLWAKYAPNEMRELVELFATFDERRNEQAGGE